MRYAHFAASLVFNTPLLIAPQRLEAIMNYLKPRFEGRAFEPAAQVEFREDRQRRPYRVTTGGVAVVPIVGTLVHRASWMDSMSSDLVSYSEVTSHLNQALEDPEVKAVLLEVDSPGGSVAGAFDLVDAVYAFRKAKPIWASANEEACSAAYALASSAQRLYLSRTGFVGSIGVIWQHVDQSKFDQDLGVKYTVFNAGARKNDFNPHFPVSKEARTWAQAEVDRVYEIFVAAVARNRGLDAEAVRATEAGLFFGPQAVEAGLADGVASFQETLEALEAEINPQSAIPGGAMAAGQDSAINKEEKVMEVTEQGKRPAAETPDAGATRGGGQKRGGKGQPGAHSRYLKRARGQGPRGHGQGTGLKDQPNRGRGQGHFGRGAPGPGQPLGPGHEARAQPRGGHGRGRRGRKPGPGHGEQHAGPGGPNLRP